ncbi:MAG: ATP-dependent DNA helicase RecG [Myxococcales bacterium]|nr:ATP-dependent DNA helicase RecG [Myxococcales bacterium]
MAPRPPGGGARGSARAAAPPQAAPRGGDPAPPEAAAGPVAGRPIRLLDTLPGQIDAVEQAARAVAQGAPSDELLPLLSGLVRRYRGPLRDRLVALGSDAAAGTLEPERAAELAELACAIRGGSRPRRAAPRRAERSTPATREPAADPRLAPVGSLPGVGPRLAERLAGHGVRTVEDLALWPPRTWRDRRRVLPLGQLQVGIYAVTWGRVVSARVGGPFWRRRVTVRLREDPESPAEEAGGDDASRPAPEAAGATAGEGPSAALPAPAATSPGPPELTLVWFRAYPGLADRFPPGARVRVAGTPLLYRDALQIVHPEILAVGDESAEGAAAEPVVPVYPRVAGFDQKRLRRVVDAAVAAVAERIEDPIPAALRETRGLRPLAECVRRLHHPADLLGPGDDPEALRAHPAGPWRRLAYGEALLLGVAVARARAAEARRPAPPLVLDDASFDRLVGRLGFAPTDAQRRAFRAVRDGIAVERPMRRLLQGDVGAGKTAVAMVGAALAAIAGRQAAILAPTEILADQHAERLERAYAAEGLRVTRLSGSLRKRERDAVLRGLALGLPQVVVGTHALLEDPVLLPRLGFVVVDEQQRFGVHQRFLLTRAKGEAAGTTPHLLVMTATPIPRTLALALYGELDLTVLDELPPGRLPVTTETCGPEERAAAYARLAERVAGGDRAFVICPLVEPSEDVPLPAATEVHAELAARLGAERVALLHGRLLPEEKLAALRRFRDGTARVLVSTTVVEVGVDVPAASGILVDGADRFGLSQLHQIRGRVGRAGQAAWCLLVRATAGEAARRRCEVLATTHDGFRIAEADLELRGAGDLFGARQAGASSFRFADPLHDAAWIAEATADARRLVAGEVPLSPGEAARLEEATARFERFWGRAYDAGAG